MTPVHSFKDSNIWIIGASGGIGAALSAQLAEAGANLFLSSRNGDKLRELGSRLPGRHSVYPFDASNAGAIKECFDTIVKDHVLPDTIIYLAGDYKPIKISEMDIETIDRIVDTNLKGAMYLLQVIVPPFLTRGSGQIALCGSVSAYRGLPNGQPYSATKAALVNLAESLRAETMNKGLDIRIINPGFVKTPMTDKNDFKMPMLIDSETAAREIVKGLASSDFEIHFPKKFTYLVKLLKWLPDNLYFKLVAR